MLPSLHQRRRICAVFTILFEHRSLIDSSLKTRFLETFKAVKWAGLPVWRWLLSKSP